jgi:PhnB protein
MATRKSSRRRRRAARKVKSAVRSTRRSVRRAPARTKVARRKVVARGGAPRKATPAKRKDGRPADWPALTPYLTVSDAARSLDFYRAAFGFKVTGQIMRNDAGAVMHAGMRLGDTAIMFAPQNPSNEMRPPASSGAPDSLTLYVYVRDVDAVAARAERAGARVLQRPADQFWGDRIAVFRDPDGYHWTFATNVGEFDPGKAPKG